MGESMTKPPKPKQNAPQSRLRPKVGQVWTMEGRPCRTIDMSEQSIGFVRHETPDSPTWTMPIKQWIADRKAGVIRIVRKTK